MNNMAKSSDISSAKDITVIINNLCAPAVYIFTFLYYCSITSTSDSSNSAMSLLNKDNNIRHSAGEIYKPLMIIFFVVTYATELLLFIEYIYHIFTSIYIITLINFHLHSIIILLYMTRYTINCVYVWNLRRRSEEYYEYTAFHGIV